MPYIAVFAPSHCPGGLPAIGQVRDHAAISFAGRTVPNLTASVWKKMYALLVTIYTTLMGVFVPIGARERVVGMGRGWQGEGKGEGLWRWGFGEGVGEGGGGLG